MANHLKEHYGEAVAPTQLAIILDICNSEVDESSKDSCVICGRELPLRELQAHLATHMESIAIFVLPMVVEEDNSKESQASGNARKRGSGEASLSGFAYLAIDDDTSQGQDTPDEPQGDDDFELDSKATFLAYHQIQVQDPSWGR
jgi:hypothetical protein